jgi:hypothetical protein
MAYIILSSHGEEFARYELRGPTVIGRSNECDVPIRDILLSRTHCRLEPVGSGEKQRWRIVDLASRNGTHVQWKPISTYTLGDHDKVRVGRTWVEFVQGAFEPAPPGTAAPKKAKTVRPADPHEALAGTISDFVYIEPDGSAQEFDGTPSPMPHAESNGSLHGPSALDELSESVSGISVVAPPKLKPKRLATTVRVTLPDRIIQSAHTDLSLQADARHLEAPAAAMVTLKPISLAARLLIGCGIGIATAMVVASGWILANG